MLVDDDAVQTEPLGAPEVVVIGEEEPLAPRSDVDMWGWLVSTIETIYIYIYIYVYTLYTPTIVIKVALYS